MSQQVDDFLKHFGTVGMKWGIRKGTTSSGVAKSKGTPKKKSEVDDMSDAELKAKLSRIKMQNEYKQLTQKKLSPGQQVVKDILANAAKQTATTYAAKYMAKVVESLLKSASTT